MLSGTVHVLCTNLGIKVWSTQHLTSARNSTYSSQLKERNHTKEVRVADKLRMHTSFSSPSSQIIYFAFTIKMVFFFFSL